MFKSKNAVEIPAIPSLADFEEYHSLATSIATRRAELQAQKDAADKLSTELVTRFDVNEFNAAKTKLQASLAQHVQAQRLIEQELRELEALRSGVISELSVKVCRGFDKPLRAAFQQHSDLLRQVAALEQSIEDSVSKLEMAGFGTGTLPRPVHFIRLGRESDKNSMIARIASHAGCVEGAVSTAA